MKRERITYQKSGVNIKAADKFVKYISNRVKKQKKNNKFKNIGSFGSFSKLPYTSNLLLVTSTDGVGTKLEIANDLNKFDTIGIDLVAMSVNDLIVQGAKPSIFLDYISIDKINLVKLKKIINGIILGCKLANCELVGGETAEMPGTYAENKFDLAGFAVGFVKKKNILNKGHVRQGNLILAIPSSGLHSNGFSLVREIIKKNKINIRKNLFLKKELITPTKIYVKEILNLINKKLIVCCANITGGGIKDNLERIIPSGLCANIYLSNIKVKPIFKWIKKRKINENEMLKTFNCGVGFCLIVKKKNVKFIKNYFVNKYKPYVIGEIVKGRKKVNFNEKILW